MTTATTTAGDAAAPTFDAAELKEIATSPGDRALAALDEGRADDARGIADASVDAHFQIRDIYTLWGAMTRAYVRREFGEDAERECLERSLRPLVRPIAELFRNGLSREAVTSVAQIVRMDAGRLEAVEEDEARIVLVASGWMGERVAALPGELPEVLEMTAAAERLCIEWLGYPPFHFDGGAGDEPLRIVMHKDPLEVPADVFERLEARRDEARIGAAFAVGGAMLFDDDERKGMRLQAYELAVRALDAGDEALARRHLSLSKTEWYPGHHLGRDLVTAMGSWIHDNHGVEHVWESVEEGYNRPIMGAMLVDLKQMGFREQVEMLASLFHQHAMKYEILETEDKFEFHTTPCGSGGRLIDEGAYEGPKSFATVRGKRIESFGLEEMPLYCMHCPATNRLVLENRLENDGPWFLLVEPDLVGGRIRGHCSFNIYKGVDRIPQDIWERVGMTPPVIDEALRRA